MATILEIRPSRNGWIVFECPGVEPMFPAKDDALSYARGRASFRSGEILVRNSAGDVEETIPLNDVNRAM
jgi:hypothetical protein